MDQQLLDAIHRVKEEDVKVILESTKTPKFGRVITKTGNSGFDPTCHCWKREGGAEWHECIHCKEPWDNYLLRWSTTITLVGWACLAGVSIIASLAK